MDITKLLIIIIAIYIILLFFDRFLKSCCHYPYVKLIEKSGIEISYFSIKWKTKTFNRLFQKWGNARPRFWKRWFSFGVYVSLVFLPISICILFYSYIKLLLNNLLKVNEEYTNEFLITPLVPGINLAASQLGYYAITLLICCIVHESGHALAAVIEDVNNVDVGCTLFLIFPAAYVNLASDKLNMLNSRKKLRVFCAGIWHNIVLAAIGYIIYLLMPIIFSLFYSYGQGVSVTHVADNSPLNHASKGLFPGDIVTAINTCDIRDSNDWYDCLSNRELLLPGICIQSELILTLDESVPVRNLGNGYVECCDSENKKNLCFEYMDSEMDEPELPEHVCLPGRTIIEKSTQYCIVVPRICPDNTYCFRPVLTNSTFLFRIVCHNRSVIYIGHPRDLYHTIDVSSFIKKSAFPVAIPDVLIKLMIYIVSISLGLGFINILPVIYMDGQHVFEMISGYLLIEAFGRQRTKLFVKIYTWCFTGFLISYLILSVFAQL